MKVEQLKPHELMALAFLSRGGPHCVGVIDDEGKMAAALTFIGLADRALVISEIGKTGPIYRITPAGRAALAAQERDT